MINLSSSLFKDIACTTLKQDIITIDEARDIMLKNAIKNNNEIGRKADASRSLNTHDAIQEFKIRNQKNGKYYVFPDLREAEAKKKLGLKLNKNLSTSGNVIHTIIGEFFENSPFYVSQLHTVLLHMILMPAFVYRGQYNTLNPAMFLVGDPDTGKSYLLSIVEVLTIKHTSIVLDSKSKLAETSSNPRQFDKKIKLINEIGVETGVTKGTDTSHNKQQITAGMCTRYVLEPQKNNDGSTTRQLKEYVNFHRCVTLMAGNISKNMLDTAMADRAVTKDISKTERPFFSSTDKRAQKNADSGLSQRELEVKKFFHHFQAFAYDTGYFIECGAYHNTNKVVNKQLSYYMDILKKKINYEGNDNRLFDKIEHVAYGMCLLRIFFGISIGSSTVIKPDEPDSFKLRRKIDKLIKVSPSDIAVAADFLGEYFFNMFYYHQMNNLLLYHLIKQ